MDLKELVRNIPGFPKEGILFRDITPLIGDADGYEALIEQMAETLRDADVDMVVGPEARGFIFGAPLAYALHAGFVPARKPGKLPRETVSVSYALEYGTAEIHVHKDAIKPGDRVLIVDDLLATGGTAKAAAELVEKLGGTVAGFAFVIELYGNGMEGRKVLADYDVLSLLQMSDQ